MPEPYVWKEQDDGRAIVIDKKGDNPTRAWFIAGASVDAARNDTNPVKPERGDPHPEHPFIVVDAVAYHRMLNGTRCEARYIPNEFLSIAQESGDDAEFVQISPYFETIERKLPVIQQVRQSFRDSTTPDRLVWEYVDVANFVYDRLAFTIEVNADISSTPQVTTMLATMDALRSELGNIHLINGIEYQFSVQDAERLSKDKYKFVYKWSSDPGVLNTLDATITHGNWAMVGTRGYGFADMDFIVPPFSRLDTGPAMNDDIPPMPDPTLPPIIQVSAIARHNDNGYLLLPGING